jgi:hypothetical protein
LKKMPFFGKPEATVIGIVHVDLGLTPPRTIQLA